MVAVSAVDWVCLLVVSASLVLGAWRGLVYEVLLLGGWALAFVAARGSADTVGHWLPMGESSESLRYAVGFALVFIGTAFVCGFFAHRARRATLLLGVRPVDRVFGAAFGTVRGALLLLALAVIALKTPLHEESWWRGSVSARWLEYALSRIDPWLPSLGRYLSG
ncbi:MAG: CvpA family protein [Burkholderiaceae bacterium]|jgi:membrane protein required for colicin V production|nr:CvpA family protein [Burkholderiaceae bacterium]